MSQTRSNSKSAPRGIRNNNPGNVLRSRTAWQGEKPFYAGDDIEFEVFTTPAYGIRAMAVTLLSYQRQHKLRSVRAIINRWCPPVHTFPDGTQKPQNTAAYVTRVAAALAVEPDAVIDVTQPATMRPLLLAIIRQENSVQPYDDATVDEAMRLAGIKLQPKA